MDDRDRREVEMGAGLQEARLNTELIEWLQKWGPRVLYVLLAVVAGYLGWTRWQAYRQNQLDKAFDEYQAERASQNPDVLLAIADKHDGKGAIWTLATLDAADILMNSGRLGVQPGVGPNTASDADALSNEEREQTYRTALSHYQAVLDRNKDDKHRARYAQKARWGIVSAEISLGEIDKARSTLEQYIALAEKDAFPENLVLGKQRLEMLPKVEQPIPIYTAAELPEPNRPLVQNFNAGTGSVGPASGILPPPQTPTEGSATTTGPSIPLRKLTPEQAEQKIKEMTGSKPDGADTPSETPEEPKTDTPQEPSADPGASK